ncbi:MAG: electron transport complex subunit RsxC [Zetaproteobacteria bacterium CG_4_9_14_3_um_filter_49_83]|nr:MAG: electron transport complex subunit RsxC [Zetaproteobacteria bacterium CG17_big_fil_post_rev_8_21_14_2_50_50_13]PIV30917.1 MAG: electron transport complex subunit RsxC [Zetaproteobacteria bacterium CG02_land_8_20_14_3_00_50_9]PIY54726.1 MAG: electron transport complex subunit RsxC [Zetaproteobacteria bacterium CG_4_10_14_0_8_um_filter_49_80]PJA34115.1 MAG: electron transport complex subunit RsxC [Zetaproteobacteria bacterium CG_4_9_14_3_um_filter_49_83]
MNSYPIRGGVHPDERKFTSEITIRRVPTPKRLYIPLKQHIGAPAKPSRVPGEIILKGALLARAQGSVSASIHSPCSGYVEDIIDWAAPHPSGLPTKTMVVVNDGKEIHEDASVPVNPLFLRPEVIAERVGQSGIVGLGGATFPSAVKLTLGQGRLTPILIINGCECEPYLTCDDRLMQERTLDVVDGIRILAQALNGSETIIAIEKNKPEAIQLMREATKKIGNIKVMPVPTRYPMGSEKQLIEHITGRQVPSGKLSADIGVMLHNIATAYAVNRAVREGKPLITRIITVAGEAVEQPGNYEVPIGMLISDLLDFCGLKEQPARLIMGGPMMGQAIPHANIPLTKGCNGILALSAAELSQRSEHPCIRCASCVDACPMGLSPLSMASLLKRDKLDEAVDIGLKDCILCGACSFSCPSGIPLVHYFNYGKGEIVSRAQQQRKDDEIKQLIQERQVRMVRLEQEREEAMAKRKAEIAARKAAQAQQEHSTKAEAA